MHSQNKIINPEFETENNKYQIEVNCNYIDGRYFYPKAKEKSYDCRSYEDLESAYEELNNFLNTDTRLTIKQINIYGTIDGKAFNEKFYNVKDYETFIRENDYRDEEALYTKPNI